MMTSDPGTYLLLLQSHITARVKLGSLGVLQVVPGYYVYTGSAFGSGGLLARTNRHRRIDKRHHWHVDFLRDHLPIVQIWFTHDPEMREHDWVRILLSMPTATVPLSGAGSSDCTAGCPSHLLFFPRRPSFADFARRAIRSIPSHALIAMVNVRESPLRDRRSTHDGRHVGGLHLNPR